MLRVWHSLNLVRYRYMVSEVKHGDDMPQIPFPAPLKMMAEWNRFHSQWNNYVLAANLDDQSLERRAAIFLACTH